MYQVTSTKGVNTTKISSINQAQALEYFEQFINATSLRNILGYFRTLCELLHLKPTYITLFYPKLKSLLSSWKAKAIWKKLDSRASHKCYGKGKIGEKTRVLIIGAGPCGLRTAIEAQLLGCKVVVVEKRDRLSRNNVLHLWPFVIEDLRALGAKKFFGKFCAGAIDHISIRQLQCILFKVALILGVEIHTEVSFESLIEPNYNDKIGWRALLKPPNHPVSQYEFDVIIGADGKRNTLTGFKRKEFRGKLAIAITANFINKHTEAEARVEEISGVAFIFNQKFFKDLYQETGIDLENIVYYKDDTHYFVMTAKKLSLLEKGVILQDLADTERLLAPDNVNRDALLNYAKEAADFSTNYQMPNSEFAVNHYGQPDIAMFDFTSMYAAENASKVLERSGYQLLMVLVGDSLLEPFWPTGSGCARGFLSALDAAWAIRCWSLGKSSPLEVMAERESIYRLLAQTTPDNLNKDWKSYSLDPSTRYPNLNKATVSPHQLISLYDTDDIQNTEKFGRSLENTYMVSRKRRRDVVDSEILIAWVKQQIESHPDLEVTNISSIFHSGKILCAIINRYRPDLIDYASLADNEPAVNNQLAIDVLEKDIGIPPIMTGPEITTSSDSLAFTTYLTQIYDVFRTEIPHVKHPKLKCNKKITKKVSKKTSAVCSSFKSKSVHLTYDESVQHYKGDFHKLSTSKCIVQASVQTINCKKQDSNESLFISSPFFPSTKPSECSIETFNRHENIIKVNNKIISLYPNKTKSNKISEKRLQPFLVSCKIEPKLQRNPFQEFSTKLRSELVRKITMKNNQKNGFQIQNNKIKSFSTFKHCLSDNSLWFSVFQDNKGIIGDPMRFKSSKSALKMIANCPYISDLKTRHLDDKNVKYLLPFSKNVVKFSLNAKMHDVEEKKSIHPEQLYSRVSNWIHSNDFQEDSEVLEKIDQPIETNIEDGYSDITSVTKCLEKKNMGRTKKLIVSNLQESINEIYKKELNITCNRIKSSGMFSPLPVFPVEKKSEHLSIPLSVFNENQESELPDTKYIPSNSKLYQKESLDLISSNTASRSNKHRRHLEGFSATKIANTDKKSKKRKTFDRTSNVILKTFLLGLVQSSIVVFTMFIMDIFINLTIYGFGTNIFDYLLSRCFSLVLFVFSK